MPEVICPEKDRCATIKYWCDPNLDFTFPGSTAGKGFIREVCCTETHKECTHYRDSRSWKCRIGLHFYDDYVPSPVVAEIPAYKWLVSHGKLKKCARCGTVQFQPKRW